jgi:hypothetical protein
MRYALNVPNVGAFADARALDTSTGGRRRWYRMQGCGSRAKIRRYYARWRSEQAGNNVISV